MKIDLKTRYKRTVIIGMGGTGKTELVKMVTKQFRNPLVYGVYPEEWEKESDKVTIFIPKDFTIETFDRFVGKLINTQSNPDSKHDALIVDDADLFFDSNFIKKSNINRLFISMRQLGLSIILISKRPQNLSTKTYENADYVIVFAVEGINVKKYLHNLHEDMEELMEKLSVDEHNFIVKEAGKKPIILNRISVKGKINRKD